uniref:Wsv154 n=1 Tax=White spot syndrome virus TaxID=92652 RepID=A0A2U9GB68_WSSV|nr:wsv154 [Shrimp white spot syndrome virus]
MKEFFTVASVWGHNAVASTASSSSPSSSLLILLLLLLPPEVILSAGSFLTLLICFIVESLANFFITRASSEPSYLLLSSSSISSSSSSPSTTALPSYGVGGGTVGEEDDDDEFSPSSSVLMGEGLASKKRLSDFDHNIHRTFFMFFIINSNIDAVEQNSHKSFISLIAHSLENPLSDCDQHRLRCTNYAVFHTRLSYRAIVLSRLHCSRTRPHEV